MYIRTENKQPGATKRKIMLQSYYDRIKLLTDAERRLGFERIGRVLKRSRLIQGLSLREFYNIDRAMYKTGLSPTIVGDIEKGNRLWRQEETIHRLIPLVFLVDHFEPSASDLYYKPVFKYQGAYYSNTAKYERMLSLAMFQWKEDGSNKEDRPKRLDLPDASYRCSNISQLTDIILGRNLISTADQINTPILVFG